MGRLTGDPELKTTQSGVSVTSFSVAVDRAYRSKDQERQTDFINCVAWRNTAEFISRYFHKGQRIALQGSLQSRKYTANDGSQRTVYEVVVDNAFFCESKGGNAGGAPSYDSQIPVYSEAKPAFSTANSGDFEDILTDEDLPF
ncbi:MAG: single-stranded DNA-binding protein [Clostridia bacterium]|nr:single-stranded DNA-binding protein [Clostridia bacterium]